MRQGEVILGITGTYISTHASLARCDFRAVPAALLLYQFQLTHLLRDATAAEQAPLKFLQFQLTHLLRDATGPPANKSGRRKHFNSRISCEMRPVRGRASALGITFQLTHLLRDATLL